MNPNPKLIDDDNPEWTEADFANAVPFSALPEDVQAVLRGLGKHRQAPAKITASVRFDADVLAAFRATGEGWQARMNNALREWLKEHAT